MEKKRLSDEELSNQVGTLIDNIVKCCKESVKSFFSIMVKRTEETASDLVDKGVDNLKQKINERESDGQETKD